jgi:hypothetical protein
LFVWSEHTFHHCGRIGKHLVGNAARRRSEALEKYELIPVADPNNPGSRKAKCAIPDAMGR